MQRVPRECLYRRCLPCSVFSAHPPTKDDASLLRYLPAGRLWIAHYIDALGAPRCRDCDVPSDALLPAAPRLRAALRGNA